MHAIPALTAFITAHLSLYHPTNDHPRIDHHRHLKPERSIFSDTFWSDDEYDENDYYKKVLTILKNPLEDSRYSSTNIFARLIVLPSFQNEYALTISLTENQYQIHTYKPDIQLWLFQTLEILESELLYMIDSESDDAEIKKQQNDIAELKNILPPNIDDVVVKECHLQINENLGKALFYLWSEALAGTRYDTTHQASPEGPAHISITVDGTVYHYAFIHEHPIQTGQTHSPPEESIMGRLVNISNRIVNLCGNPDDVEVLKIQNDAQTLTKDLKRDRGAQN